MTSTSSQPSSSSATAVTTRPGMPRSRVAAGHHCTPPGAAACACPAQPVASTAGGSFCSFPFLCRNENDRGTAFLFPGSCNSQQICGNVAIPLP